MEGRMKVLILGGTGMAGHIISMYFKEAGHDVTVFTRSKYEHCRNIIGDIKDFSRLKGIIEAGDYEGIINAIGILNQEAEDKKSEAILLNSYLSHFLTDVTKEMKSRVVHMSTDCVFSGKTGGYTEKSFRDGDGFYDRSKALGELEDDKNLTFRTSIIGPDLDENGIGLFNWFMKQEGPVSGYKKVLWTGVSTLTLAKAMEQAFIEKLSGLYNLVNNCSISKYDLLSLFNEYMKQGNQEIISSEEVSLDKSLVNQRGDFSFKIPSYDDMIKEMKEWIYSHREIYPHYSIIVNNKGLG